MKQYVHLFTESSAGFTDKHVAYYGFYVLDNSELRRLAEQIELPLTWKVYAHHCTLGMGNAPDDVRPSLGVKYDIMASEIGAFDDRVIALRIAPVRGFDFGGRVPHITLAVNIRAGAKPKDSNEIKKWDRLRSPIVLKTVFAEFNAAGDVLTEY